MNMPPSYLSAFPYAARRALPMLVLAALLSGCSLPLMRSQAAEQATHSYLLEWQGGVAPQEANRKGPVLLVSPILAAAGFDGSDMAYVRKSHEIEYFARHRWVDAPARMLDPLLVAAAEQSGLFRSVAGTASGTNADLRLDSKLIHLQQICRASGSELQLALRVTLVEVASARGIASRTLSASEPLAECTPYAGVEAANRALTRVLTALQGFLAEQVRVSRR